MKHQRYMLKLLIYVLLCAGAISAYPIHLRKTRSEILDTREEKQTIENVDNGAIISVRITSSVAVARGKKGRDYTEKTDSKMDLIPSSTRHVTATQRTKHKHIEEHQVSASERHFVTALPPSLAGANIEFIKQLRSKKEGKSLHNADNIHPFRRALQRQNESITDSIAEASQLDIHEHADASEEEDTVPRARSIALSPYGNSFHASESKVNVTRNPRPNSTTTSVRNDVVHGPPNHPIVYSEPSKVYSEPAKIYSEPAKVYGKPELFYSEPAKVYGEPAKVYGEPSKVYGEPAKIYSEPSKVYGEPSKYYSKPASLNLDGNEPQNWAASPSESITKGETMASSSEAPKTSDATETSSEARPHEPESTTADNKVGYVLEGSDYRKYRVEERTADGFIVGEYGVVSHNDGSLRGVRYTADGDTNPRLIYDALIKFLHLTK